MLKIRLKRAGGRNRPFYRVVVVDSRKARDSRALEEIGYYNPLEKPFLINVDRERVDYWKERGAQVTDSVKTLLKRENAVHVSRRAVPDFTPPPPKEIEAKAKKKVKGKVAKAAVATEEAPATTEASGAEQGGTVETKAATSKVEKTEPADAKAEKPKAEAAPAKDAGDKKPSEVKAEFAAQTETPDAKAPAADAKEKAEAKPADEKKSGKKAAKKTEE